MKISFVGNPNTGKTYLFNRLTGLNQKTGNYPGTTTEKKSGSFFLEENHRVEVTDLPGTYSLSPSSTDEQIVSDILMDSSHPFFPSQILVVVDAIHLKRGLYLLSQILELNIPTILVINQIEVAKKKGISINSEILEFHFGCPVQCVSVRKNIGIEKLKQKISEVRKTLPSHSNYPSFLKNFLAKQESKNGFSELSSHITYNEFLTIDPDEHSFGFSPKKIDELRIKERILRYKKINDILSLSVTKNSKSAVDFSSRIDYIFNSPYMGLCNIF